ncbi:MAG: DUF4249 domain-containing protein [Flavobacteriales bacterium]|nr:DUF4249 domain-containing protein [Flavobacteriales bacterium]
MKSALKYFAFIFGILVLGACEDKVELDFPEGETLLAVEGSISNEPGPYHISLTYTQAYFDAEIPPRATDATVFLSDDEGLQVLLEETSPGVYTYPDSGIVGRSYVLEIELPDGEQYRSNPELLREPVPILDIRWVIDEDGPSDFFDQEPDQIYGVLIDTFEPPGVGDNYRWRTFVNGVMKNDPFDITVTNDDFVDGSPVNDFDPSNELFFEGDTVTVVQERISRAALEFLQLVQSQTAFVGGPFDTPPAPIRGNVKNISDPNRNALGFFGAAGRDRATVVAGVE